MVAAGRGPRGPIWNALRSARMARGVTCGAGSRDAAGPAVVGRLALGGEQGAVDVADEARGVLVDAGMVRRVARLRGASPGAAASRGSRRWRRDPRVRRRPPSTGCRRGRPPSARSPPSWSGSRRGSGNGSPGDRSPFSAGRGRSRYSRRRRAGSATKQGRRVRSRATGPLRSICRGCDVMLLPRAGIDSVRRAARIALRLGPRIGSRPCSSHSLQGASTPGRGQATMVAGVARSGPGCAMAEKESRCLACAWCSGRRAGVGSIAVRTIAERPDLELVGVWVHGRDKQGRDAGELAGGRSSGSPRRTTPTHSSPCAPTASVTPRAASRGTRECIDDFERMLAAGINVVTTSVPGLVHPAGFDPRARSSASTAACRAGGASLYASGIEPGFAGDELVLRLATSDPSHPERPDPGDLLLHRLPGALHDLRGLRLRQAAGGDAA